MKEDAIKIAGMDILKNGDNVYMSESEYNKAATGYKGIWDTERWDIDGWEEKRLNYIGRRTYMPPVSLFGHTCLLVEGHNFEIVPDAKFKHISEKATSCNNTESK